MSILNTGVSPASAAGMALAALVMVLTPGPNMIYLVSRSIGQGRAAGLISLAGTGAGFIVYMTMANVGLAVVFVAVPWLYIGLKATGVLYLGYLAWQSLRPHGQALFDPRFVTRDSPLRLFRMGLITNLVNPKTAVMYLALIPQFVNPDAGNATAQGFVLGSIQIAVSMAVNGVIILAAGSIAGFLASRPTWMLWQRRVTGTLLGVVAVVLAREVPDRAHV